MNAIQLKSTNWRSAITLTLAIVCGIVVFLTPDWRTKLLAAYGNQTQANMGFVIQEACDRGREGASNDQQFQIRCEALDSSLVGQGEQDNAIRLISPDQPAAIGTGTTRTTRKQVQSGQAAINSRLLALRKGLDTTQFAGILFYQNGKPLTRDSYTEHSSNTGLTGAAGGDSIGDLGRLGVWVNAIYNFGNVDSVPANLGFSYDNGGVNIGVDYRFTDDLVFGGVFTYLRSQSRFDDSRGSLDSDFFNGSLYGSYYVTDSFHIDGIASYGGSDFDISRAIQYQLTTEPSPVITNATSSPGGHQYSFSGGLGYDFNIDEFSINPYVRANYLALGVDAYRENGGAGWALNVAKQKVYSLTTTVGTQMSYTFSTPWGVIIPNVRGEWFHEFEDNGRQFGANFVGDAAGQSFNIVTIGPDRDYFTFGTGVSTTLPHGISAFFNYDMLIGYQDIENYRFTLGARMEF